MDVGGKERVAGLKSADRKQKRQAKDWRDPRSDGLAEGNGREAVCDAQ